MTSAQPSAAARIAAGAAIGLVAGLVASLAMDRFQALTQPSSDEDGEPATQKAADKMVLVATGFPLSAGNKAFGGQLVHYGLGAILGASYGIAAELAPQVTTGGGTAFAATTWAILDEAAVPAAGLGDAPWESAPSTQAYSFVSHMVFGLVAELTRKLLRRALLPTILEV